jgi:RimJ/RimL family protein N-acetyltransferase
MIRAAPLLESARLLLRPFRAADVDAQAAMMADDEVMRHIGGRGLSREEAWRKLLCGHALWDLLGYGYWAVERRADGAMIGQLGFADFKREMAPGIETLPEMGWLFVREAFGQGYASEAAAAALAWADEALAAPEIVAIIDADNQASIRVAEKAGFSERQDAVYRDASILLFRRPRPLAAV